MGVAASMLLSRSIAPPPSSGSSMPTVPALDAFCKALSKATGLSVTPHLCNDYPALLEAMQSGKVSFAWLPPVVALRAISIGRALPIALPLRGGVSVFHSALFARQDTSIKDELDVFGVKAAWVDKQSAAGYLVIRAALRTRGLGFERAFKEEQFYGSHDAVVQAVLRGQADVGATYVHLGPNEEVRRAGWGDADVKVISLYGPIPADMIAASSKLPSRVIRGVQGALVDESLRTLRVASMRLLEADGFVEAESSHLKPLESLLRYLEDSPRRWGSMFPTK